MTVVGIFGSAYAPNIYVFTAIQLIYGIGVGARNPLTSAYLTENVTIKYRSSAIGIGQGLMFCVGEVYAVVIG